MSECDAMPDTKKHWTMVLGAIGSENSHYYAEFDVLHGGIIDDRSIMFYVKSIQSKRFVGLKRGTNGYILVIEDSPEGKNYVVFTREENAWFFIRGKAKGHEGNILKICTVTGVGKVVHGAEFLDRFAEAGNVDYTLPENPPKPRIINDGKDVFEKADQKILAEMATGKGPWA
jgi:hypothetical protein